MVISILQSLPPVSPYSQACCYEQDKLINEKQPALAAEQPKPPTRPLTMAERSASADPFVHAENTWNALNSTDYSLMVKSVRDVLFLLVGKKPSNAIDIVQPDQTDSSAHSYATATPSANAARAEAIPIPTAASDNLPRQTHQESGECLTAYKGSTTDPIVGLPLRREMSSRPDSSTWSWSMIKSKGNNDDDLPISIQPGLQAQQKEPAWSRTHSYVRDIRVNSAELRMLSAELNMIRDSKITRSLKNRRYRVKREDAFIWGRRSCLRIVRVGEHTNNDKH